MRLRNDLVRPVLVCTEASTAIAECLACARTAASELSRGWRTAIGAPDYRAYLAHHAARHPGTAPMSERDYVATFIAHRYGRGGGRCC